MSNTSAWMKGGLALGLLAIITIAVQTRMAGAEDARWDQLAAARAEGFTIEALENARAEVEGSDVEPWCSFYLAMELYSTGDDLDRARQVASESIEKFQNHATTPMLAELLEALKSYSDS